MHFLTQVRAGTFGDPSRFVQRNPYTGRLEIVVPNTSWLEQKKDTWAVQEEATLGNLAFPMLARPEHPTKACPSNEGIRAPKKPKKDP